MFYLETDGKKVPSVIRYFNGDITKENLNEAKQIQPDEEYWSVIMGVREPDADPSLYEHTDAQMYRYLTNYWVRQDLHDKIVEKCKEIGIPEELADNLSVPISNFPMTRKLPIDKEIRNRARDAKTLHDFLTELESNPLLHLTKLSFEYAEGPLFDCQENKYNTRQVGTVTIKNDRVLLRFLQEFKRVLKSNKRLRDTLINPADMKHVDFDHQAARTRLNHGSVIIIAIFLMDKLVCKTKSEALGKAGMLLSIHGYVISRKEFENSIDNKLEEGYVTYEKYVQKIVIERVGSLLSKKKKKGKSSKK